MLGISPIDADPATPVRYAPVEQSRAMGSDVSARLMQILREQRWKVLAIIAATIALGVVLTMLQPRYYTAQTRMEFKPEETLVQATDTDAASALVLNEQYFQTQYELLRSRSLARDVAIGEDAMSDPEFAAAFGLEGEQITEKRAINTLLDALEVEPIIDSNLADITFTTRDPAYSARLADAWAEAFIAADIERRFGASIQAREFLNSRLAETREKLQDAEQALIEFASRNQILNLPSDSEGAAAENSPTLVSSRLESLNDRLGEARAERIAAASRLGSARSGTSSNTSGTLVQLRSRRAELAARVAGLEERFGDGYPPLRSAREELAQIDSAIASEAGVYRGGLQEQYNAALQAERALQSEVTQLTQSLISERRTGVQYGFLAREVDTNRQLYDALLQRVKEVGVAPTERSNIVVIDEAETPQVPSFPNPVLNVVAATLAGLVFAGLFVGGTFALDQVIRSPEELQKLTGRPVIGSIPVNEGDDAIEELGDRLSPVYESFLSASLSLRHLIGDDHKSALMTSSQSGEGKSYTSIGLSYALSRSGMKVLLVDADVRRGRLNGWLDLPKRPGLSDYIADFDTDELPIRRYEDFGFDVMTVGQYPPNPGEAITSGRMMQLHQSVLERYDFVLYDGPPILGLADAVHMARMVDLVIYAVQANEIRSRKIYSAQNRLAQVGTDIDAFIMTQTPTSEEYGYDYSYSRESD
ncbi:polysaccharide biosynthesis tyrosine autokinase [Alteriqipengyuania flavescens]|uniref:GumC family protein n=1 Tax=Alteriqipengyuania flavescens TaxID=3053610 RepID=UPI0025B4FFA1|nr:polysaccharide biosynthesis tyrosine autokinase [Alteriqipengyuania flavescens]WJY18925.1 polysaccharide biosynthesis tyrosine autokinase [Alteriqipengyuania flavescens]WJY24865.1 polysaccharide biosynthesis tyrosine autokinase [Alteriqipengyuania flavescens]